MKTPVAFIIFKRPNTTERVFEAIRQAKPPKLFVIADGPRIDRPGEAEKCEATRAIIERIDWDCEVIKNYSDTNLGSGKRVSSGLDFVFGNVEEAIILEDDCLPHPTFFSFCEELLERYRYDERIGSISGQNVQLGRKRTEYSYYFSRYNHVWGWATWKRAWQNYEFDMKSWPEINQKDYLNNILIKSRRIYEWTERFQSTYDGLIDAWDYQWQLTCWIHNYLGIISNVNLISNIGFGGGATNTTNLKSKFANLSTEVIEFPLKHPLSIFTDVQADDFSEKNFFREANLIHKIKAEIKYLLREKFFRKIPHRIMTKLN